MSAVTSGSSGPQLAREEYRERVRAAINVFAAQAPSWERDGHLPRELFATMGEVGAFVDRWTLGPSGGLPFAMALVGEMAQLNGGAAIGMSIHCEVFIQALLRFGGPDHSGVLNAALSGEVIGAAAFTEPTGGSDLFAMRTQATMQPDGWWHLAGQKRYITNAALATHVIVYARTGVDPPAYGLFLVPTNEPGVVITKAFETLGMRSTDTNAITLDVRIPPGSLIGRRNAGLLYALKLLDYERLAASAAVISAARHGLALATAHMRTRQQFGRRLFDHQALAHRLVDRWVDVQAATALVDAAVASARGDELPHHMVAAAKLFSVRAALNALDESIQFFGARGYTEDFPLERMYRDTRLARIGGGTDEVLRQIIAMHLDMPDMASETQISQFEDMAVTPEIHYEGKAST